MVRLVPSALLLAALAPAALAHSSGLAKRQAETVALTALTNGPVSYVSVLASVSASCTARCAPMIASSTSCTEDSCACAASAQTVTCMNCLLESATPAQGTTVTNGFETYGQACVDEGYLGVVPVLNQAAGVASSSSITSSSVRSSSATSSSASRTSSAVAAGSTAGYSAFSNWVTAVGNAVCTTDCAPALNAFAACSATDTCICTTTNFAYGQTCNTCLNLNAEGYWTTANLQQIAQLWQTAGTACNIAVVAAPANTNTGTTTRRGTSTGANTLWPSATGAPQQSYFAPSTTATTTTAPPTRGTAAANSPGSAGERNIKAAGLAGVAGAAGWALLALA